MKLDAVNGGSSLAAAIENLALETLEGEPQEMRISERIWRYGFDVLVESGRDRIHRKRKRMAEDARTSDEHDRSLGDQVRSLPILQQRPQ